MGIWQNKLLLCFLLALIQESLQQNVKPLVRTALGQIEGTVMQTQQGAEIYAFRGIPYAVPPLEHLRFVAPQPAEPWTGTLKASRDSLVCPQQGATIFMSEDCLKLNIFSRNLTGLAPVIVYIHGGANVLGSGHSQYEAGPQYLLDHDVVFVAFNYRLGALGFLSTGSKDAPGNYGYLDQVLALKWVQNHIEHFGGNPDLVTLFGVSAGAMAVTLHMASPLSKNLFHRAIAMSGSATNHFNIDNVGLTRRLAREVSCPMYNAPDMLQCLRNVSWKTIASVCAEWEPYGFTNMKWNYEIDGHFLPAHPTQIFAQNKFNQVSLLTGFTKNELDYSTNHQAKNSRLLNDISVNFDMYAPELFLYNDTEEGQKKQSERIKKFYLDKRNDIAEDNLQDFGEMFSDGIIGHGVHRLVQLASRTLPVYYYRMDYVGRRSNYNQSAAEAKGVGHADDLQYVMPGLWYGTQLKLDDPDMFMVDRITTWWTTFAKDGIPSAEWHASTKQKIWTLYNDNQTHVGAVPFAERYALWDDMFPIRKSNVTRLSWAVFNVIVMKLLAIFIS